MKQIPLLMISSLCLLPVARAQTSRDAEGEIRDLEQQRFEAMQHVDVAALNRILSDDLVYTHSSGLEQTKAELIGVLGSGDFKYESISASSTRIRIYDDTATPRPHFRVHGAACRCRSHEHLRCGFEAGSTAVAPTGRIACSCGTRLTTGRAPFLPSQPFFAATHLNEGTL